MFCPNCGASLKEGARFCSKCGTSIAPPPESDVTDTPITEVPVSDMPAPEAPVSAPTPAGEETSSGAVFTTLLSSGAEAEHSAPTATLEPPAPAAVSPVYTATDLPPVPPTAKPKSKTPIIIAVAAVLLVAVAAVAAFFLLGDGDPRAYVAKAMDATLSAYTTEDELGLTSVLNATNTGMSRQTVSLRLGNDLPEGTLDSFAAMLGLTPEDLSKSGFTMVSEQDLANRKLNMSITGDLGDFRPGSIRMFMDDATLSLNSPELTGETFYGFNTETFGKDWNASIFADSYSGSIPEDVSFNLFDALDTQTTAPAEGEEVDTSEILEAETQAELETLYKTYNDAITVVKGDMADVDVNGRTVSCKSYVMTIPGDALRDFVNSSAKSLSGDSLLRDYMLASLTPALMSQLGYYGEDPKTMWDEGRKEFLDSLKEVLSYLKDDVTVTFYIADKTVVRLEGTAKFKADEDSDDTIGASLVLQFGDERAMQNALSADLTLKNGDSKIKMSFSSQGNHKLEDGKYTDETTFSCSIDGRDEMTLSLSTEYDTAATSDNFSFRMDMEQYDTELGTFGMKGTVLIDAKANTLSADMDSFYVEVEGQRMGIAGSYKLEPIGTFSFTPGETSNILTMSEDELMEVLVQMQTGVEAVTEKFYTLHPDLRPLDPVKYLQGYLDARYLGQSDDYFLEQSSYTGSDAQALFDEQLTLGAEDLLSNLGFYDPSDAMLERAREITRQIYAKSTITANTATEYSTEDWYVTVDVQAPDMNAMLELPMNALWEEFQTIYQETDTSDMDYDAFEVWYDGLEEQLCLAMLDAVEAALPNAPSGITETYNINVYNDYEGSYNISDDDVYYITYQVNSAVGYFYH